METEMALTFSAAAFFTEGNQSMFSGGVPYVKTKLNIQVFY